MCTTESKTGEAVENERFLSIQLPRIVHQSLVVSHRYCSRTSDICNIYKNDIDVRLNNFIAKFAYDTKIGNSVISDSNTQSLQDDLSKFSARYDRWEMPFYVKKCHSLQLGTRNQNYEYKKSGVKLESVQCVKNLRVTIASKLKFSQNCKKASDKANRILDFINKSFPSGTGI